MATALVIEHADAGKAQTPHAAVSPQRAAAPHGPSMLSVLARREGWSAKRVDNPQAALKCLKEESFEVLLAEASSVRGSEEWLAEVREDYEHLPVILVAAERGDEATVQALVLGAATFVPRSVVARDLVATVERILALCGRGKAPELSNCLTESDHRYVLGNNRDQIPAVLCHVQSELDRYGVCNRADRLRIAVALEESLANAIIHGNLEVSSQLRERGDDSFERQIAARRSMAPYRDRQATLTAAFKRGEATFIVADQGRGFDPAQLPDPTDPENLVKPHGRGLLLMRTFMDDVQHNDRGNTVTMVKRAKPVSVES